jgi:threonine dehydrogenase-like Zn-dependent dehydrogenase
LVLLSEWAPEYTIVIEPHEFLRDKAKKLGATEAFPPVKSKLKRFFKKHGEPTFIFECAGNENALNLSFDIIERGGTIVLESVYKGHISIPAFTLNVKEVALKGTLSHDRDDIVNAIDLLAKKKVDVNELISEIVPLKDIQKVFEKFLDPGERTFIKILIDATN